MAKYKFPAVIHVTWEAYDEDDDDDYLAVYTDGVASQDEHGRGMAVYKLVEVGSVEIKRVFKSKKSKKG